MRHHRVRFATVLVAAALAAPLPAGAAPRRVCDLLPGTPSGSQSRGIPYDHPLVIRSADVASNARAVTAVIRVKDLGDAAGAAHGRSFGWGFSRNAEETYYLKADVWTTSTRFWLESSSLRFEPKSGVTMPEYTFLADVTGVVDVARDEVRITAPLSAFRLPDGRSTMKPGARISYFDVWTAAMYGVDRHALPVPLPDGAYTAAGITNDSEWGTNKVSYVLGTPSCVAVGR